MSKKTKKLEPKEALAEGEKILMREASQGMSDESKRKARQDYLRRGVPKTTVNKLFPDLPPVK